jgi:hypothetical protein
MHNDWPISATRDLLSLGDSDVDINGDVNVNCFDDSDSEYLTMPRTAGLILLWWVGHCVPIWLLLLGRGLSSRDLQPRVY